MDKLSVERILKGNVFFKGKLLDISQYEQKSIKIFEEMFENENKINFLITPDKEAIEILVLIILGIHLYIKNLNDEENNILDYLNIGDIVVYKGKKAEYVGIEKMYGDEKIKLKYMGNMINGIRMKDSIDYIRISDCYKLTIYRGSSKRTSTMSNDKSKKKSGKYILADMLDIDLENLSSIVKQQMVIVYPNKHELEDLLSNIKIKVKNKKHYLTEIFPCKYYSSIDNTIDFKGNKLKLKEIFIFTSNLSVAAELIQENKERNNLLLLGEDTYANEVGGELDVLLGRKKFKKIYMLNTFDKCMKLEQLIEKGFDIKLNAWTRTVFLQNFNKMYLNQVCFKNKKIYAFLNRKLDNKIIEECADVAKNLLKLRIKLLDLLKDDFYCNNQEIFLRASYGLLKIFEKIVIPIKEYDEFIISNDLNKYTVYELIEKLISILEENKLYEDSYTVLESIVEIIKQVNDLLYYKNPKLECVESLNLGYGDLILCSNSIEQNILEQYEFIENKSIIVGCIKNYRFYNSFKRIVVTGLYNTKNMDQIYCYNGVNIINLLYPSEVAKFNTKINKFNKLSKLIEENNSLGSSNNIGILQRVNVDYNKFIEDEIIDDVNVEHAEKEIEKSIYLNTGNYNYTGILENDLEVEELLNISIQQSACSTYLEHDNGHVKKYVKFKDDKCALLTQFYRCKYLDGQNNSVMEKGINLLQVGDKLIFVHDRTEDEITELFHRIMCSDKFKSKYHRHYYNMNYWKNILKRYIDSYFEEYSLITTELLLHGINRSEQAIRTWVSDENIIGPREKEIYKALADITNDNYFLENWNEIYESCTSIRSLKTKLKNNFNYMVIKSAVNEKTEGTFENLVYDVLGDLKRYAQIEEIHKISDVLIKVPINKTNCVLKEDVVYQEFE